MRRRERMSPLLARYQCTLVVSVLILIAVLLPGSLFRTVSPRAAVSDKLVHFSMFFLLTIAFALERRADRGKLPSFAALLLALSVFGLATEAVQLVTKDRSFETLDLLADIAGVAAARAFLGGLGFLGACRRSGIRKGDGGRGIPGEGRSGVGREPERP